MIKKQGRFADNNMLPHTIFIIRKIALGDVLWVEPVIRQLSLKYKKVVFKTEFASLFKNYPLTNVSFVDSFSVYHKIMYKIHRYYNWRSKYIELDKAYEQNPRMHILHAYQGKANLPATIEYPKLYLKDSDSEVPVPAGKFIILHLETTSMRNFRNVYGVEWNTIIQYITDKGLEVIQLGIYPQQVKGARYIKTDLHGMTKLIDHCDLFIGIDSGPSHIAAALGKRCLIFFGSVNPWYRHFKALFNGTIMQSYCEFQHCYHEVTSTNGITCRLVGDEGKPICCIHNTVDVIENIGNLLDRKISL
ncbi:MAG: glycosyltransferase family 9 protein [Ferruginibacter sp.]